MKIPILTIFILSTFFGMGIGQSNAQTVVTFGPMEAKIIGSIPYTVIGKYKAQFRSFKGRITLEHGKVRSVYLEIEANSIKSDHPWLDKLARSRRLLNTVRYPKIIFKSDKIIQDASGYNVKGVLEMHGIKRKLIFPFYVEIIDDQNSTRKILDLKGSWVIDRKDFNIVWSRYLDRGGIVVGDDFTVDWGVKAYIYD